MVSLPLTQTGEGRQGLSLSADEGQGEPNRRQEGHGIAEVARFGHGSSRRTLARPIRRKIPPRPRGSSTIGFIARPIAGPRGPSRSRGSRSQERRHPARRIAQHRQRPRGIDRQQDQGCGEDGLWLREHRRPRGIASAEMLRRQAAATAEAKNRSSESGLALRDLYHAKLPEPPFSFLSRVAIAAYL